jgi:hypothetical protein
VSDLFLPLSVFSLKHLSGNGADGASSSGTGLMSQEVLHNISTIVAGSSSENPSSQALDAHIADLEQEVRDLDFRLYFLYRQRLAALELLSTAKSRAEKYKA